VMNDKTGNARWGGAEGRGWKRRRGRKGREGREGGAKGAAGRLGSGEGGVAVLEREGGGEGPLGGGLGELDVQRPTGRAPSPPQMEQNGPYRSRTCDLRVISTTL